MDSTVLSSPILRTIRPWCVIHVLTKFLSCSFLAQGGELNDTTLTKVCDRTSQFDKESVTNNKSVINFTCVTGPNLWPTFKGAFCTICLAWKIKFWKICATLICCW